jgi:hypothetical protein
MDNHIQRRTTPFVLDCTRTGKNLLNVIGPRTGNEKLFGPLPGLSMVSKKVASRIELAGNE